MKKIILGIDVGGTNIKLGLVNPQARIIARDSFPTQGYIARKALLIKELIQSCRKIIFQNQLSKQQIAGIGLGLPGLINAKEGIVYSLTNVPGWHNVPLKKILEKAFKIPVFIDNDVNVIALGEWKYGSGKGKRNMICITLGTGIGGGLILGNKLFRGEGFAAGEIGHIPIEQKGRKCNCGGQGCLETFTGNRYLLEQAKKVFRKKDISLEEVTRLAKSGDVVAQDFWYTLGQEIGIGLTGVVNVLNPSCIVVGGGIANAYTYISRGILRTIRSRAMRVQGRMVKIVKSRLGPDAGIIGAKVLVDEEVKVF